MAILKFRAFDKRKGYLNTNLQNDDGGMNEHDLMYCLMFPDRFDIMQSTGMTDHNGVEIYEGDVVRQPSIVFDSGESYEVVTWISHYAEYSIYWDVKPIVVVGNIYENPELLEKIK